MSRWAVTRPWRVELDPVRRRRAQELRGARRQPWWPRPFGLLLLGCALLAAIRGEYPLPRGNEAAASSATGTNYLSLRLLQPLGNTDCRTPRFEWQLLPEASVASVGVAGQEPRFELVLLDEDMRQLLRAEGQAGAACESTGALADALRHGRIYYWFVEAQLAGGLVRSPLGRLEFSR